MRQEGSGRRVLRVRSEPDGSRSYAVTWREPDGAVRAGKLELRPNALHLASGTPRRRRSEQTLRYADLSAVEMTRRPSERIHGRPTAMIKRPGRAPLAVAAISGPGALHELVERLADAIWSAARG
jgi:hypothetical protein